MISLLALLSVGCMPGVWTARGGADQGTARNIRAERCEDKAALLDGPFSAGPSPLLNWAALGDRYSIGSPQLR